MPALPVFSDERKQQIAEMAEKNFDAALQVFSQIKLGKWDKQTKTIQVQKLDVDGSDFSGVLAKMHTAKKLPEILEMFKAPFFKVKENKFKDLWQECIPLNDSNSLFYVGIDGGGMMGKVEALNT